MHRQSPRCGPGTRSGFHAADSGLRGRWRGGGLARRDGRVPERLTPSFLPSAFWAPLPLPRPSVSWGQQFLTHLTASLSSRTGHIQALWTFKINPRRSPCDLPLLVPPRSAV